MTFLGACLVFMTSDTKVFQLHKEHLLFGFHNSKKIVPKDFFFRFLHLTQRPQLVWLGCATTPKLSTFKL